MFLSESTTFESGFVMDCAEIASKMELLTSVINR